jgi:chromate reductase
LAPPELELSEISIKDLPLYSYDYDADYPPVARAFKDAMPLPALMLCFS